MSGFVQPDKEAEKAFRKMVKDSILFYSILFYSIDASIVIIKSRNTMYYWVTAFIFIRSKIIHIMTNICYTINEE